MFQSSGGTTMYGWCGTHFNFSWHIWTHFGFTNTRFGLSDTAWNKKLKIDGKKEKYTKTASYPSQPNNYKMYM